MGFGVDFVLESDNVITQRLGVNCFTDRFVESESKSFLAKVSGKADVLSAASLLAGEWFAEDVLR